ncbi:MAG: transcription elongation factor GreA [Chloroflexi bacterium]|nr:transcription elongation factor GreA [Chloroflexota bacterium]
MVEKPVFLTPEGKATLEMELKHLCTVRRHEVAERINQAKGYGDIMESGEYEDAKNEQGFIEGRIRTIGSILSRCELIENDHSDHATVKLGSRVTILDHEGRQETWTIVGSAESNSRNGKISNESLVGAALMGRKAGEKVAVNAPAGQLELTILSIE